MEGVEGAMVKMETKTKAMKAKKAVAKKVVITKSMKIGEIIQKKPESAEILMAAGMGCIYCPAAGMETLEQGACAHGIDVKKLLRDLNK